MLVFSASVLAISPLAAAQPEITLPPRTEQPRPAARPAQAAPAAAKAAPVAGHWSIVLTAFRGTDQVQLAQAALQRINTSGKLPGAYTETRGEATVVAVGRYPDPADAAAAQKLTAVRGLEIDGRKPFLGAFLAPPDGLANTGSTPQYHLSKAREEFGERARYSLQVGAYGREDIQGRDPTEAELKEARQKAEEAAARLRREGELAYYYHGRRLSMVTIGVWSDDDLARKANAAENITARAENPELTALRGRFPYNLYNGQAVKEKTRNKTGNTREKVVKMQTSELVLIPAN